MYNFLDKLISIALPRVKDFRGVPKKGFDGRGNYNFGLDEQLIFPEIDYDFIMKTHGMNIAIITSSDDDKEAYTLLEKLGMPFKKGKR
jgi:large subunit ribosomal protein L5